MYVIILVAGKSIRFHGQKQFLEFHGKMWEHLYDFVSSIIPKSQIDVSELI